MTKWLSTILSYSLVVYTLVLYLAIACDNYISNSNKGLMYDSVLDIPYKKVGLLLGTSKYISNGTKNLYFSYRIDAASQLFYSQKIDYILVSGDNATKQYNEPITIKKELIKHGIPEDRIVLDYAGFRTFDSMIRAKEVFGQQELIVISQPFHNERAIFIGRKNGMDVIGYNAKDVSDYSGFKTQLREKFARVKVLLDIYLLNTKPKFLGEKIEIES
ncbi:SanA/YdcF family protein [Acidiluteibacter ferrifornacis]|uniref:Vancomycin high temperature exclusion protein n=1 Tax=Acidiluteibacter ferrifornacis TaxID=2692424 RepID=A0A6N9NIH3_9FLAO|nr:ElyC/SanA/YdcF family protein [Acidiluteibacter ferrifornacis]NBG65010.1 vancomycin high temperature exclusion protein [Acidiluteibacter ferrifornacis]